MRNKVVRESDMVGGSIALLLTCWLLSLFMQGCAAPLLLGVKSYKSGDTQIDFITGADFNIGAHGLDTVDDRRGIQPSGGARR